MRLVGVRVDAVRAVQRIEPAEHRLPELRHGDRGRAGLDEEVHDVRRRRLMIDRHPARHVHLRDRRRVEDPHVHEGHDEPVARVAAEVLLGVLDEVLAAEVPADAGEDGDALPSDRCALEPVEARDRHVVTLGEVRGEQAGLLTVARRRKWRVAVPEELGHASAIKIGRPGWASVAGQGVHGSKAFRRCPRRGA
jgi:hypothetical protein